jgi:hypothetical protein
MHLSTVPAEILPLLMMPPRALVVRLFRRWRLWRGKNRF